MSLATKEVSDFRDAVTRLANFGNSQTRPLGPNFGVAIAVMLHRHDPSRFMVTSDGKPTTTSQLQLKVCDPTWEKKDEFLPSTASGPIYKPFTESFKGRSPAVNNWRNSFDIQGGIGCNAPLTPLYLQSADYIAEHRFDCRFRDQLTGQCGLSQVDAKCFNPEKKGNGLPAWAPTNAGHRPKLLRRGADLSGSLGYWSIEPTVGSLADLLRDPGVRVPATDFATVLFGGSAYWSEEGSGNSAVRLQKLLALDDERFLTIFEGAPVAVMSGNQQTANTAASEHPQDAKDVLPLDFVHKASLAAPLDYVEADLTIVIQQAGKERDPEQRRRLLESATRGHRRVLNTLAKALKRRGFDVNEQPGGYDLHASDGKFRHLLFEAKTWTASNLASQVRSGWAQLEEYAYRNQNLLGESVELVLALNHKPPADFWAWSWFTNRGAPYVIWLEGEHFATFDDHSGWLDALMGTADSSANGGSAIPVLPFDLASSQEP